MSNSKLTSKPFCDNCLYNLIDNIRRCFIFWYQDKSLLSTLRQKAEEAHVSSGKGFKPVPGDILIYPTGTTITHQIITQARRNTVVKKEKECVHVAIVDTNGRVNEMTIKIV